MDSESGLGLRELTEALCLLVGAPTDALIFSDAIAPTAHESGMRVVHTPRDAAELVLSVLVAGIGMHVDVPLPEDEK